VALVLPCRGGNQEYSQIAAVIEGEEAPTHRAIQERIGIIRKGVLSHGVAQFFRNGAVAVPRTKNPKARARAAEQQELGPQEPGEQKDSAHIFSGGATGLQGRLPDVSVKEETLAASIKHENPDGNVTISAVDDQGNTTPSPHRDSNTRVSGTGQPTTTHRRGFTSQRGNPFTSPPPTIASNQPKNRSTRKRRRSDTDTGSESASMTETSDTEVSLVAPDFDMRLRPEHRRVNTYGSDGDSREPDSDDSDGAWVPHAEDVGHRAKRVRR
jgi:hypothetical protein